MKKKIITSGIIYSTDPNYKLEFEGGAEESTLPPNQQKLKIKLETKHRAGKAVTLVDGFVGTQNDRDELSKKLKNYCGTGGSSKDGEILIQGDQREKVFQYLQKNGYVNSKKN